MREATKTAISILPNFLITGILIMLLNMAAFIQAGWFVQRKHAVLALIGLWIAQHAVK